MYPVNTALQKTLPPSAQNPAAGDRLASVAHPAIAEANEAVCCSCGAMVCRGIKKLIFPLSAAILITLIVCFCVSNPAGWLSTALGVSISTAKILLGTATGVSGIGSLYGMIRWWRQKPSIPAARQQLQKVGGSKTRAKKNRSDIDLIARTVMRCPNQEAKEALYKLHQTLREQVKHFSNGYLQWLLGGSSYDARGGFTDARSARKFLAKDPRAWTNTSRLITGLSTFIHAIGYRAVFSNKCVLPTVYPGQKNFSEREMDGQINRLFLSILLDNKFDHSTRYPDSRTCEVSTLSGPDDFEGVAREELSDVSDDEDNTPLPKRGKACLKTKRADGKYTWVGAAHAAGIPIKVMISGSTPIVLRALKSFGQFSPKELPLLAGTLLVPTYHRADYHTIAETGAGYHHHQFPQSGSANDALNPKDALAIGLELMRDCVDPKYKTSVQVLSQSVLDSTQDVGYSPH